jgi:hypothetical protein
LRTLAQRCPTLRLNQTGTLNLDDETINILYQKRIIGSTIVVCLYAFLHALLKNAKRQLHDKMPTPPDIDQATSIGSFASNLEKYYLHSGTIGVAFDEKTQSSFFLSALHQKGIEIDRFVDRLNNVPERTHSLRSSPSPSSFCGSRISSPCRIRRLPLSTVSPIAPRTHHLNISITVLLASLATWMHIPTHVAKLALITALLALIPALLVRFVNAHRCSAFVAAVATLWTSVNRLRCTS